MNNDKVELDVRGWQQQFTDAVTPFMISCNKKSKQMIQNNEQLVITKKWRDDFQAAMQETIRKMPETTENDRIKKQLYIDTQQSTIDCFNEEIADYETNGPTIWSNWSKE